MSPSALNLMDREAREKLKTSVRSLKHIRHIGFEEENETSFQAETKTGASQFQAQLGKLIQEPLDKGPFEPGYPRYVPIKEKIHEDKNVQNCRNEEQNIWGRLLYERYTNRVAALPPSKGEDNVENAAPEFDSNFESGNLLRVIQIGIAEFELHMETDDDTLDADTYQVSPSRWFYFSVKRLKARQSYTFHIVGFTNMESLYGNNGGCLPLFYSTKGAEQNGEGWRRIGENVSFGRTGTDLFTLTFTFSINHDLDLCYFSSGYPYTYSDLQQYIKTCEEHSKKKRYLRRELLCRSLAGNRCDLLTIGNTSPSSPCIILSARVHSSEFCSSWMMHGLIDFLLGESPEAIRIREKVLIKVVPMLNPDGVMCGKTRFSLARVDLNRMYGDPSPDLHPTVFHFRKLLNHTPNLRFFCDFHGHSKKQNVFAYACDSNQRIWNAPFSKSEHVSSNTNRQEVLDFKESCNNSTNTESNGCASYINYPREFVSILDKISPLFSSKHSNFRSPRSVSSSARVYLNHVRPYVLSMTLEGSLSGMTTGAFSGMHLSSRHYIQIGYHFGYALDVFLTDVLVQN